MPMAHKMPHLPSANHPSLKIDPAKVAKMVNTESFRRYVEVGRVVLVNSGDSAGKLAVIVEIIDHNKAIIDGPSTGVPRQAIPYRYTTLTPHIIAKLPRGAGTPVVKKAFEKAGITEKWATSAWAKKRQAAKAKKNTTDFDRFQIMMLKKQRRYQLNRAIAKTSA